MRLRDTANAIDEILAAGLSVELNPKGSWVHVRIFSFAAGWSRKYLFQATAPSSAIGLDLAVGYFRDHLKQYPSGGIQGEAEPNEADS